MFSRWPKWCQFDVSGDTVIHPHLHHQIGPGVKNTRVWRSSSHRRGAFMWGPETLPQIRARNGVGRPPAIAKAQMLRLIGRVLGRRLVRVG